MLLSELSFEGGQPPIDAYAPGGFRILRRFVTGPILLSASGALAWPADDPAGALIGAGRLQALLALAGDVDVLLIGMGAEMARLDPAIEEQLFEVGLGVAPMSTPSACRAYNVALSEERRVAAALEPV